MISTVPSSPLTRSQSPVCSRIVGGDTLAACIEHIAASLWVCSPLKRIEVSADQYRVRRQRTIASVDCLALWNRSESGVVAFEQGQNLFYREEEELFAIPGQRTRPQDKGPQRPQDASLLRACRLTLMSRCSRPGDLATQLRCLAWVAVLETVPRSRLRRFLAGEQRHDIRWRFAQSGELLIDPMRVLGRAWVRDLEQVRAVVTVLTGKGRTIDLATHQLCQALQGSQAG